MSIELKLKEKALELIEGEQKLKSISVDFGKKLKRFRESGRSETVTRYYIGNFEIKLLTENTSVVPLRFFSDAIGKSMSYLSYVEGGKRQPTKSLSIKLLNFLDGIGGPSSLNNEGKELYRTTEQLVALYDQGEDDFGQLLKSYRKSVKLSQPELGVHLGVSKATIHKYENLKKVPSEVLKVLIRVIDGNAKQEE